MSFLSPGYLTAALIAAAGSVLLHFIVTRRPRSMPLPTARFVPDVPVAARTRSIQFSDLLLLAVRVLTILCAGAALARPIFPPQRERVVRVIAADVSGSVASIAETRDSVRAMYRPGDALVAFDTAARTIASPDSIGKAPRVSAAGLLSPALVAALRAGAGVRGGADSVELVLISPVTAAEKDRATSLIRAQWRGRARVVPVAANVARTASGAYAPNFLGSARPLYATARNRVDTAGAVVAVVAGGSVLVAPFERRWKFTADSLARSRVIARWADGEPAAIERDSALGCTRSIAIPIDTSGDMLLRPSFTRFREALSKSCGQVASPPDMATRRMLAGAGSLASTTQFAASVDVDSPLAPWLAAVALLLAIAEMVIRRSRDAEIEQ